MTLKRLFSAVVLLAATIAFVAFMVIAVGIWFVTAELNRRTERVLHEADTALDRAQPVARMIREAIETAELELKTARPTAKAPGDIPAIPRMLLRSALKEAPQRVDTATRAVDVMSDLLVVAHVALDTMQNAPGVSPTDAGELASLRQKLTSSAIALHKADAILNSTSPNKNDSISAKESRVVEGALAESRGVAVEVEDKLATVHGQVATLREQIPQRLSQAAWAIFLLSLLGAIGQVGLVRWVRSCRRR